MENALRGYVPANVFEALGLMTVIAMDSGYSDMTIEEIEEYFVPALEVGQFKVYLDHKQRPSAFVTWALVNDECHDALLLHGRNPPSNLWQSGNNLWFLDVVAPHGNALRVIRDLQRNHFPNLHAHSIKRNVDGSVRRIKVWRNALVGRHDSR